MAIENLPPVGTPVICRLKSETGKLIEAELIHVDEDDVTWRTADDNSELNEWSWDVIHWEPKPEIPAV